MLTLGLLLSLLLVSRLGHQELDVVDWLVQASLKYGFDSGLLQWILKVEVVTLACFFLIVFTLAFFLEPVEMLSVEHIELVRLLDKDRSEGIKIDLDIERKDSVLEGGSAQDVLDQLKLLLRDIFLFKDNSLTDSLHTVLDQKLVDVPRLVGEHVIRRHLCQHVFDLKPGSKLLMLSELKDSLLQMVIRRKGGDDDIVGLCLGGCALDQR